MDHPLPAPDTVVRPWRVAALVAVTVAAIELLILLAVAGGALVDAASARLELAARETATAPSRTHSRETTTRRPAAKAKAELPRRRTVVQVLNGNGRTGAAAAAASRVRARGYKIGFVGNASSTSYARSIVMFKPGFAGEANRLARDLRVRSVTPLDGIRPRQLGRAHVVFILGA